MANATEDPAVAPTTATTTTTEASGKGNSNNRRRIIKAATPKAATNGVVTPGVTAADTYPSPAAVNGSGGNDSDDSNNSKPKKANSKKEHALKPLVADDPEEATDEWRNERLKATEKRGKALREKELARRRATPVNNNDSANATANPFSRFLSVFSVEPQFPEHKRSLEAGEEADDNVVPSGKRLKPSDTDAEEPNGSASSGGTGIMMSKAVWVAAALAVAVGVAIALQRGRKK